MTGYAVESGRGAPPRYRRSPAPVPPPPPLRRLDEPAEPAPTRRHVLRALTAMAGACGLAATCGLPALSATTVDAEAPGHLDPEVQRMRVGDAGQPTPVELDSMTAAAGGAAAALLSWALPLHGSLRDGFGPRPHRPVAGANAFHAGQDLAAAIGTTIHAATDGVVAQAQWWGTYGNWVMINHGSGLATGYAHLSRIGVSVGQRVREGQLIGLSGSTGASTGPHLHLEAHISGVAVDPLPFFRARGLALGS